MPASSSASITSLTMNPENQEAKAWAILRSHGAAQLAPGFPDRVLRESLARAAAAPSLFGQFALSVATAALCFLAVAIFDARTSSAATETNQADWQQIASASDNLSQAQ